MLQGSSGLFRGRRSSRVGPGRAFSSSRAGGGCAVFAREWAIVCNRKLQMSWREAGKFPGLVGSSCHVVPLIDEHDCARRHRLSFYDACVVATALSEGCKRLLID
ncbi:hypothetical protein BLAT2472_30480 [Burkholderia latens]